MKKLLNILRYFFWTMVVIPPMLFWAIIIGYFFDDAGHCLDGGVGFGIMMKNAVERIV